MVKTYNVTDKNVGLVSVEGLTVEGADNELQQTTIKEIVLAEHITTPGLQTSVTIQSAIYQPLSKNLDNFKNKGLSFSLSSRTGTLAVSQQVYRLDNRYMMPVNVGQTEEYTLHACDPSTLNDAQDLVSKSWKCVTPNQVVSHILNQCLSVNQSDVESCGPARDYIAENIHPFQVIAQQCNVALNGDDPSFTHYMTYEQGGTHKFKSLKSLCEASSVFTIKHGETGAAGGGYQSPDVALAFSFPCDFDYLSDLLNGLDENGQNTNTLGVWNPVAKSFSLLGAGMGMDSCGIGGSNYKVALTNTGTDKDQDSCLIDVESHLLKRQARMALLEKDKIALRVAIPWNPNIHVGNVITLQWKNKNSEGTDVYGAGDYLVTGMQHSIRLGGFSTTTLECVSKTVGQGGIL